jgi:protein-serine/threonine kinase
MGDDPSRSAWPHQASRELHRHPPAFPSLDARPTTYVFTAPSGQDQPASDSVASVKGSGETGTSGGSSRRIATVSDDDDDCDCSSATADNLDDRQTSSHFSSLPTTTTTTSSSSTAAAAVVTPLPPVIQTPHGRDPSATGPHLSVEVEHLSSNAALLPSATPTIIEHKTEGIKRAAAPDSLDLNSLRRGLSTTSMASSLSPGSAISSPALNALSDITPLPSPMILGSDSPGPWKRGGNTSRPGSQGSMTATGAEQLSWVPHSSAPSRSSSKKKSYTGLSPAALEAFSTNMKHADEAAESTHQRNRSLSEYTPEGLHVSRPRHVTVTGGPTTETDSSTPVAQLHREHYLAEQRGLVGPHSVRLKEAATAPAALPTPPPSNRSATESEEDEQAGLSESDTPIAYLVVRHGDSNRKHYYRPIRQLGQGTFSKVMLATTERLSAKANDTIDEATLNPKKLVAIKIVEHGPAGGADEDRVELSLKREVEMLRSVEHPSLVHLKEFDHDEHHALLVLDYCAGGDLFDLASGHRDALNAEMVQRMFAELVSAVRYLHTNLIVHRDIKLESMQSCSTSSYANYRITDSP